MIPQPLCQLSSVPAVSMATWSGRALKAVQVDLGDFDASPSCAVQPSKAGQPDTGRSHRPARFFAMPKAVASIQRAQGKLGRFERMAPHVCGVVEHH